MDTFAKITTAAEQWLQANNSNFKILAKDEHENRLVFGLPGDVNSFNIIYPNNGETWSVCSQQESMLMQLQDVMEYLDSHRNLTIDMVLTRISKSITSSNGRTGHQAYGKESDDDDSFEDADEGEDEDDEEDCCNYYVEEDPDAQEDDMEKEEKEKDDSEMGTFFQPSTSSSHATSPATIQRLCSDLKGITKVGEKYGFIAKPVGNNLCKWDVKLINIPEDCRLGKDLQRYAKEKKCEAVITMEMQFPNDYPFSPPFLRVIQPRFKFLTGHVTIGGSICMEMLTKSGWLPSNDIEGILVQVRTEILSDPNASLDLSNMDRPYTEQEARVAFHRMVQRYGWGK